MLVVAAVFVWPDVNIGAEMNVNPRVCVVVWMVCSGGFMCSNLECVFCGTVCWR